MWSVQGEVALELLSDGRQTVIPPTVHPQTDAPYYWAVESLTDIEKIELPALPADFFDQVGAVVARHSGQESSSRGVPMGNVMAPLVLGEGDVEALREAAVIPGS